MATRVACSDMEAWPAEPLACPHCAGRMSHEGRALRCANGHSFDIARQGYVTLARALRHRGDSAAMLDARSEFLAAGHFDRIAEAVTAAAGGSPPGPVV